MVQLPYLQPFDDVNKRVSRLAANIQLIKRNLAPLSFTDVPRCSSHSTEASLLGRFFPSLLVWPCSFFHFRIWRSTPSGTYLKYALRR
jgi:hypothetical protein